jgi:hypothetical protein
LVDRTNERAADLRQSRLTAGGNDDRDQRWRQRYARTYSYNDDTFYQQCRNGPDPAAVITGGLIGGLVGNAAGRDDNRTGGTIAGVIVGAAIGAALTNDMECQDRSYAYRTSNRPIAITIGAIRATTIMAVSMSTNITTIPTASGARPIVRRRRSIGAPGTRKVMLANNPTACGWSWIDRRRARGART